MDSVKLFDDQEIKVRTDEGKILINLIHVAKCCGLTRKNKIDFRHKRAEGI